MRLTLAALALLTLTPAAKAGPFSRWRSRANPCCVPVQHYATHYATANPCCPPAQIAWNQTWAWQGGQQLCCAPCQPTTTWTNPSGQNIQPAETTAPPLNPNQPMPRPVPNQQPLPRGTADY